MALEAAAGVSTLKSEDGIAGSDLAVVSPRHGSERPRSRPYRTLPETSDGDVFWNYRSSVVPPDLHVANRSLAAVFNLLGQDLLND